VPKRKTRLSVVWIIPIVAAVIGVWVAITQIMSKGPSITITFQTAEGLEAGKTQIHYNGVEVGTLKTIRLSEDHRSVIATAQMEPETEPFLVDDTRFWVVSARISGANVSGLGTLLSGSYIAMEIGQSKTAKREFVALATPPVVTGDVPGRFFMLKTPNLGSLDTGTPIFFRRLKVGQVASYELDPDGKQLTVKVFVNAPYDQYVTPDTRFWDASGIDMSLTANGLTLQTQSVLSILVGGIAFETPANGEPLPPAEANTVFNLYGDRTNAFRLPARKPQSFQLVFTDSVRGLSVGAPVEFRGIQVGEVVAISAQIDAKTFQFSVPVTIEVDAQRLGVKVVDLGSDVDFENVRRTMFNDLVTHGVRAQLQTGNLLTGQLFVSFDFFPDAPPVTIDWSQKPVQLPTTPGQFQALADRAESIIKKLDELPLKQIGDDLQKTMNNLDKTIVTANTALVTANSALETGRGTIENANKLIEPNSVLGAQLGNTLQQVSEAARSVRLLADFLERHPEALIRGKTGEAK
jgi:paraquat-inducible protein B